jgi:DNA-directed RNA polymerase specialized sigma24 family protein
MTNSEEFKRLYVAHYERVLATLRRVGVPVESLEDAAQEMYPHLESKFDVVHIQKFSGWICLSARNWAISQYRRGVNRSESLPFGGDGVAVEGISPLDELIVREDHARLSECRKRLSAVEQAIVQAKIDGFSSKEIVADLLRKSPPISRTPHQVNTEFFQIKRKLRECMESKAARDGGEARR